MEILLELYRLPCFLELEILTKDSREGRECVYQSEYMLLVNRITATKRFIRQMPQEATGGGRSEGRRREKGRKLLEHCVVQ